MGSILDSLLADRPPRPSYEVFDSPKDFELKPVNKYLDYTPVVLIRMSWCNMNGTDGRSKKAVVHARCDRQIGNKQKGETLCGYKSKAKYGCEHYSVPQEITCPKCKKLTQELSESLIHIADYGWCS